MQDRMLRLAASPDKFAPAVERALQDERPFARHAVGIDAKLMLYGGKVVPGSLLSWIAARVIGLPAPAPPALAREPAPGHRVERLVAPGQLRVASA
jgi:hypothetical protein